MQNSTLPKKPFRTAYGPKLDTELIFTGPGRTKQAFKAECDINTIMARYQKTGVLEFTQKHAAQYEDVTALDYTAGMLQIAAAKSMFADLPAHLRARFENEPARFLDFVQDPRNTAEAIELGLATAREPDPVEEPAEASRSTRKAAPKGGDTSPQDQSTT